MNTANGLSSQSPGLCKAADLLDPSLVDLSGLSLVSDSRCPHDSIESIVAAVTPPFAFSSPISGGLPHLAAAQDLNDGASAGERQRPRAGGQQHQQRPSAVENRIEATLTEIGHTPWLKRKTKRSSDTSVVRGPGKRQVKPNVHFLESDIPDFDDEDDDFEEDAVVGEDEEESDGAGEDGCSGDGSGTGSSGEESEKDSDDDADADADDTEDEQSESIQENGMPVLRPADIRSSSPAGTSSAPLLSREQSVQGLTLKPPEPNTRCTLCLNLKSKKKEELLQCDKCGIAVHESCYGPMDYHDDNASQSSSSSTEPWFCEPCLYGLLEPPYCTMCPNRFGAFKRAEGGDWVHLNCALWTAGVTFLDEHHMAAVSWRGVDSREFGKKACSLCEDKIEARTGITTQCDAALCKSFFHISCAQKHGLLFDHTDCGGEGTSSHALDPRIVACKKHSSSDEVKVQRRAYLHMQAEEERRMVNYRRKILTAREVRKKEHFKKLHMENWNSLDISYNHGTPGPRMLHQHPEFVKEMEEKLDGPDGAAEEFKKNFNKVHRVDKLHFLPAGFSSEFVRYFEYRQQKLIPKVMTDLANSERTKEELKAKQIMIHERIDKLHAESNENKEKLEGVDKKVHFMFKLLTSLGAKKISVPTSVQNMSGTGTESAKRKRGRPRSNSQRDASGRTSPQKQMQRLINTCFECKQTTDQHLLALCDMCNNHYHLSCLDPPLTSMPKKTRLAGWMCSNCAESSGDESSVIEVPQTRRTRAPPKTFTPHVPTKRSRASKE
uniref:PHD finger protein 14 n=1 Tax=Steinernema glaseri TaxID=37863 RepID=A0A1I7YET9_9BILA